MSLYVFLSEAQDSCAPAALLQLRLAHSGQSIMCGSSLDPAVLSMSLFRQVQQSPCQCHHVFIAEGNPTAKLLIRALIMYHRHISECRSACLSSSFSSFTSLFLFLPFPLPGDYKRTDMLFTTSTLCASQ